MRPPQAPSALQPCHSGHGQAGSGAGGEANGRCLHPAPNGEARPEKRVVDAQPALSTPRAHGARCSVGVSRGTPWGPVPPAQKARVAEGTTGGVPVLYGGPREREDWPVEPCPPESLVQRGVWEGRPEVRAMGKPIPFGCCCRPAWTALGLLYLGFPAGGGIPSAQASLGVPAFLGFCLAFLSMWTCPKQTRSEGWVTLQATQHHLSPFHKRQDWGSCDCGGSSLPLASGSPAPWGSRGSSP